MTFQRRDIPWNIRVGRHPLWMQSPEQQAWLLSAPVTRPCSGITRRNHIASGCTGHQPKWAYIFNLRWRTEITSWEDCISVIYLRTTEGGRDLWEGWELWSCCSAQGGLVGRLHSPWPSQQCGQVLRMDVLFPSQPLGEITKKKERQVNTISLNFGKMETVQ